MGMTPGASSWNFCSILRRWPPLDILMRLWNTAAYGSPCRDLYKTCTSQLSMPHHVTLIACTGPYIEDREHSADLCHRRC